jgi:TorA maturation chaperone TorD
MDFVRPLRDRAVLYPLLYRAFSGAPDEELVGAFVSAQVDDRELHRLLGLLRATVTQVADMHAWLCQVEVEHTRVFEGPGAPLAPPYASYYLNSGVLVGPETIAVRRAYIERGLAPIDMGRIPDDHISLEFAFLAHLTADALDAFDRDDQEAYKASLAAEAAFVHDHLESWISRFCERIKAGSDDQFFHVLANMTCAVIDNAVGNDRTRCL